jgi:hypothetical protein
MKRVARRRCHLDLLVELNSEIGFDATDAGNHLPIGFAYGYRSRSRVAWCTRCPAMI